jgi:hypothetical protein
MKFAIVTAVDYANGIITIGPASLVARRRRTRPKHCMRTRRAMWQRVALEPGTRVAQFQRGMRVAIMPPVYL